MLYEIWMLVGGRGDLEEPHAKEARHGLQQRILQCIFILGVLHNPRDNFTSQVACRGPRATIHPEAMQVVAPQTASPSTFISQDVFIDEASTGSTPHPRVVFNERRHAHDVCNPYQGCV